MLSKPSASIQSLDPLLINCLAKYNAVEPVAQILRKLNIGIPVSPIV